jgi:hypothetical protein
MPKTYITVSRFKNENSVKRWVEDNIEGHLCVSYVGPLVEQKKNLPTKETKGI